MSITLKAGERMRVTTPAGDLTIEWTRAGQFRVSATADVTVIRGTITRITVPGKPPARNIAASREREA